jgi:hypothetical protein
VWACSGFAALLVPLAAPALPPPMHQWCQDEWACDGGASNLLLRSLVVRLSSGWQMPQSVLANTVKACELFEPRCSVHTNSTPTNEITA